MRQLREGLDALNFESNDVLQHNQPRIVYALELHPNAKALLALNRSRPIDSPSMEAVATKWIERWLSKRVMNDEILDRMESIGVDTVKADLALTNAPTQLSIGEL